MIAVDLSWQSKLDTDLKAIQQIEVVGQLKSLDNNNVVDADGRQSMFALMILEKIKETKL